MVNIDKPVSLILVESTLYPSFADLDLSTVSAVALGILFTLSILATLTIYFHHFQKDWEKERLRSCALDIANQLYVEKREMSKELEIKEKKMRELSQQLEQWESALSDVENHLSREEWSLRQATAKLQRFVPLWPRSRKRLNPFPLLTPGFA